jgi:hypothetical protein
LLSPPSAARAEKNSACGLLNTTVLMLSSHRLFIICCSQKVTSDGNSNPQEEMEKNTNDNITNCMINLHLLPFSTFESLPHMF